MALLKAQTRTSTGTRRTRTLRKDDKVPAIIYGHGETPQAIALDKTELSLMMKHGDRLVEVEIEGKVQNALLKDVQYDAMGDVILHVDLARVNLDELVKVTVTINLRGVPAGAVDGGVLTQIIADAHLECQVRSIPEEIRVNVNDMKVGDKLSLKDLPLPQGAKLLGDPEAIVATVSLITEKEEVEGEEAAAAPEVIGAKEEEEGGEEAPKK